ncbi:MAG: glycoside hydrolase family protein [Chitinophagaceae bacterium]|jgi:predicted GH43/DUF377 family glycosyl hydrolase|nr:glycoside hydrolase family protein [Chitinophagaceae bacterium]
MKRDYGKIKVTMMLASMFSISARSQTPMLDKQGHLASMEDVDISAMIQPIPAGNVFSDSTYNIWCGSVIKGRNGKFYMLYSRWPRKWGHEAWITHSEIALARADSLQGPYHHLKVIFPARGKQYWDGVCTHNPAVIEHQGKYYLYYMGSTGQSYVKPHTSYENPNWWEYRNNQRIGVAVADDLEGNWQRFDKPVLDVNPDSTAFDGLLVSNPAITIDPQGKVMLVYKAVEKNGTVQGGQVRFGVAFASDIMGPFVKHGKPIFQLDELQSKKAWMIAEDPFIWYYKGMYYAIVRDVKGYFTNGKAALALLHASDGIHWRPTPFPEVVPPRLRFENGLLSDDKLERPWLYTEKGMPLVLFGALGMNNRSYSVNVAVPLKATMKMPAPN